MSLNYRGTYNDDTTYYEGDVVVYEDGVPYLMKESAPSGTKCHDTLYWNRLDDPLASVVEMFHNMLDGLIESATTAAGITQIVDTMLFDSKTIMLQSSSEDSEKVFAITVDDSGDIDATEVETEAEGGES